MAQPQLTMQATSARKVLARRCKGGKFTQDHPRLSVTEVIRKRKGKDFSPIKKRRDAIAALSSYRLSNLIIA